MKVIGFVDTLPCAAAYHAKFKPLFEQGEAGTGASSFGTDGEHDWKSARNLIARVQALLSGETEKCQSFVTALESGHVIPWGRELADDNRDRFVVPVSTGPGAFLHVGPFSAPLVVGQVVQFNPITFHSVVNFGPVPLVALALDLRCPS